MRSFDHVLDIAHAQDGFDTIYIVPNGLYVRDVVIDTGIGTEVCIGHLSDVHLNYCNEEDFAQADPVIMSTYQNRQFSSGAATLPKLHRCMALLDDADLVVFNGDTMDYLSNGTVELMRNEVFQKYPNIIATMGGHERARQMQGTVEDPTSLEHRLNLLQQFWIHDLFYTSRLLQGKVLVIGMCNDQARYTHQQYQQLKEDLTLARQNGYAVLLFAHEPIATQNPAHQNITKEDAMLVGDRTGFPKDYCTGESRGSYLVGSCCCDEITLNVYRLILSSADVIKGVFAGHHHSDFHLDILATVPDGTPAVIPQYIHNATAYHNGHLMRIFVK